MNRHSMLTACAAAAACAVVTGSARAAIIAGWNFEVSVPTTAGPHTAEVGFNAGTSFASGFHASASVVYSNPAGNGSAESFSSNFWSIGDYYQFTTSTIGYTGITINWDQTRSSTGPGTWDLYWSTDGSLFTLLTDNYAVPAINWLSSTPDGTGTTSFAAVGPAALDNQTTIYFRLVADAAAGGTSGTSRVDNILIQGVPSPGALALVAIGGMFSGRRRRR
jgi:MYXO-CTERM domain-containing protein